MRGKVGIRGQVTLFIILAIVIVGGVITFFVLKNPFSEEIPSDMRVVYDYYLSCVHESAREGINLLGEQGGYIEAPEFQKGSSYSPFSSQLDFLGQGVPYWMYLSGNNLLKEQVPTKDEMESELSNYISSGILNCDFSDFESRGYYVSIGEVFVDSKINNLDVSLKVNNPLTIYKDNKSVMVDSHKVLVNSKLGKFYDMALDVYNYEKSDMFLEKYALDVMRLYAPVDGVDFTCTPKIFVDSEIRSQIVSGLSSNIPTIKLEGDYYSLSSSQREYFVKDSGISIDENVNFMYNEEWPTRIEIYGDRVAKPVGLQEGMGVLGFCYVPYHFVYDISFPVMVQFFDEEELFQFPISVIISKSQAREAMPSTSGVSIDSSVCEYKNQEVEVYTYDSNLNPVESTIRFKCLNSYCDIGATESLGEESYLKANFPSCVNGFIVASAPGYADSKYQISTNSQNVANIIMKKKYNITLDLGNVDSALVSFDGEDYSTTVLYPDMRSVELIEDYYNVSVYAYDNSSLKFPAINDRKCVEVPESGLSGMFGLVKEKCFDVNIPEMDITFAVVGGGKTSEYIYEDLLENFRELNINVPLFGVPNSLEKLQENNMRVEEEYIYLEFE